MPVSQTTFDQRVKRISRGITVDAAAQVGKRKQRRSLRERCNTFPFFVGLGILVGGPAYAFVSTEPDMTWVIASVKSVIAMVV